MDVELAEYRRRLPELLAKLKQLGGLHFAQRARPDDSHPGWGGLSNQGATCYLNSLLQTLFFTPDLRSAIYDWPSPLDSRVPDERNIPLQLQLLFARLQCSSQAAVDTKALTQAFGWTNAELFQQHDVQELLRVLLDALERARAATLTRLAAAADGAPDAAAGASIPDVRALYTGRLSDSLQCLSCQRTRGRVDEFMDLQLNVRGAPTLEQALEQYTAKEVLDGDNKCTCDDCGTKTPTSKGLSLTQLPPLLTLHLKRFVFDWNLGRRIKVNDPQTIPVELDMTPFVEANDGAKDAGGDGEDALVYDLFSIFIHSGTAAGGHYHCYVRVELASGGPQGTINGWVDCNDSSVSPISDADLQRLLNAAAAAAPASSATDPAEAASSPTDTNSGAASASAYPVEQPSSHAENVPAALAAGTSDSSADAPAVSGFGSAQSSTNAYMVMYRRRSLPLPPAAALQPPPRLVQLMADERAGFEADAALYKMHSRVVELRVHLPGSGSNSPVVLVHMLPEATLEESLDQTLAQLAQLVVQKRASPESSPAPEVGPAPALSPSTLSAVQTALEAAKACDGPDDRRGRLRLRRYGAINGRPLDTYGGREQQWLSELGLAPAADMLLEARSPQDPPFSEYNPREVVLHFGLWDRTTCCIQPGSDQLIVVPGEGNATAGDALRAATAHFRPICGGWMESAPPGSAADSSSEKQSPPQPDDPLLPAPAPPSSSPTLVFVRPGHGGVERLNDNLERKLHPDLGILSGDQLIVDVGDPTAASASAFAHFDALHNLVDIVIRYPQAPPPWQTEGEGEGEGEGGVGNVGEERARSPPPVIAPMNEYILAVDLRLTTGELRERIAAALDLPADKIHLKRSETAPQLKEEAQTLRSLGLTNGSPVVVGYGPPMGPDEFLAKIYVLHAGKFKYCLDFVLGKEEKVLTAKKRLAAALDGCAKALPFRPDNWQPRAGFVRLRDKKISEVGKVLRDNQRLRVGLTRLVDGRHLAVQLLTHAETVGRDDLILQVRRLSFSPRKLHAPEEIMAKKTATLDELSALLAARFDLEGSFIPSDGEEEDEDEKEAAGDVGSGGEKQKPQSQPQPLFAWAKANAFGPPLTSAAALKLKWNAWYGDGGAQIGQPPVSLRDGSVLLVASARELGQSERRTQRRARATRTTVAAGIRGGARLRGRGRGSRRPNFTSSTKLDSVSIVTSARRPERALHIDVYDESDADLALALEADGMGGAAGDEGGDEAGDEAAAPIPSPTAFVVDLGDADADAPLPHSET